MKKLFITAIMTVTLMSGLAQHYPADALDLSDPERLGTIVLTLLMPEIRCAVDEFYEPYLTVRPTVVAYYGSKIVGIDGGRDSAHYTVTVEVLPYIGPHLSVGRDRLTLYISPSGIVTVKNFEHLESGRLPRHYQASIKKPLP